MRKLALFKVSVLALALLAPAVARAQSAEFQTIVSAQAVPAGAVWYPAASNYADATFMPRGGTLFVEAYSDDGAAADSTKSDSLAFELYIVGGTSRRATDSGASYIWDADDSNAKLDGYFLTCLDSVALTQGEGGTATNRHAHLTGVSGASALSTYPWTFSSRVALGRANAAWSGGELVQYAGSTFTWQSRRVRRWAIPFADAFGNPPQLGRFSVIIANRSRRIALKASVFFQTTK